MNKNPIRFAVVPEPRSSLDKPLGASQANEETSHTFANNGQSNDETFGRFGIPKAGATLQQINRGRRSLFLLARIFSLHPFTTVPPYFLLLIARQGTKRFTHHHHGLHKRVLVPADEDACQDGH